MCPALCRILQQGGAGLCGAAAPGQCCNGPHCPGLAVRGFGLSVGACMYCGGRQNGESCISHVPKGAVPAVSLCLELRCLCTYLRGRGTGLKYVIIVSRGSVLLLSPGMRTGGQGPLSEDTNTRHSKVEELPGNTSEVSMSLTHPNHSPSFSSEVFSRGFRNEAAVSVAEQALGCPCQVPLLLSPAHQLTRCCRPSTPTVR